ncbi:MAG: arsenical pump-driving ATPase [Candidatus Omnitrophica bacterium]|nr:arsenical pump-driving ATPase [Candidatus Omnitrophota bacterium]
MKTLMEEATRFLFFTGKGGVGKTSVSCAVAVGLADSGKKVLLISTDPASNLDEVLETKLSSTPTAVANVANLHAMNINPVKAAEEYRRRMIDPYKGVLPDESIKQMEEQLSGACTVEIAGFNEFSKFIGLKEASIEYDHLILDTAPTGHTLRLLNLPSAWSDFIASNKASSSCLGPLSGLKEQQHLYQAVVDELKNPKQTTLVLVSRPEKMSLDEAARASGELGLLGLNNQRLVINGVFKTSSEDEIAKAFALTSALAMQNVPDEIKHLDKTIINFRSQGVVGIEALRNMLDDKTHAPELKVIAKLKEELSEALKNTCKWSEFMSSLENDGSGVIMTMGKGGVGKTTVAAMITVELASRGHKVLLSTTDPAAHIAKVIKTEIANLSIDKIDPKIETRKYVESVLKENREKLSREDMELLEEEMRSPCIEEIAVFKAFAQTVAKGENQFIVLDTAPTGHTLLLLDATESYHRQVAKSTDNMSDDVKELLPRIRDPKFTKLVIISLAEATPTHEAEALQVDLQRAGINPFGWVINRNFAVSGSKDPLICAKGFHELTFINETANKLSKRTVVLPWMVNISEDSINGRK